MKLPKIFKYSILLAVLPLSGGGDAAPLTSPVAAKCKPSIPFPNGLRVLGGVRIVLDKNGESAFAPLKIDAKIRAYFKPGELFSSINFGSAAKVQIVSGPPNVALPYRPSLGYEMFLTLQGSSTVVLSGNREQVIKPGMMVVMEDMGSKSGHGGRTGSCGYVALQIVPTEPLK